MGSVAGCNTRRYHGHLVAAIEPPTSRMVLLANIETTVLDGEEEVGLSCNQYVGAVYPKGHELLESFSQTDHAEWVWRLGDKHLRKRLKMNSAGESCTIDYTNLSSEPVSITLRPLVCHKFYHDNFRVADFYPEFIVFPNDRTILSHQGVLLCLHHPGATRTPTTGWYYRFEYSREAERGLDPVDDLFCPCELRYTLAPGETIALAAGTSDSVVPEAFEESSVELSTRAKLEKAVRTFLVQSESRTSILAGYPWFTDWGRDTMISLSGTCLTTGETEKARQILFSYASQMSRGLIPNRFVDRGQTPEYNTVDATLWFVNAIYETLMAEWHETLAVQAATWIQEIVKWHKEGTWYGIKVDPTDCLLSQGQQGVQLTWMDAKVGGWVVTPRHGKPIEVNGLWINCLWIGAWLAYKVGQDPEPYRELAEQAEENMEKKFWHEVTGHFLDTVDPDDASLRPNQVIAMSLPFAPLRGPKAERALAKIRASLLTRHGLRTLGPLEPGYQGRFEGPMQMRDGAYHQGTAWPWLLGPYLTATLKVTGDLAHVKAVLFGTEAWLAECGLGGVSEVYDGDEPQRPGGCPWQAWSAAELLRVWDSVEKMESESS